MTILLVFSLWVLFAVSSAFSPSLFIIVEQNYYNDTQPAPLYHYDNYMQSWTHMPMDAPYLSIVSGPSAPGSGSNSTLYSVPWVNLDYPIFYILNHGEWLKIECDINGQFSGPMERVVVTDAGDVMFYDSLMETHEDGIICNAFTKKAKALPAFFSSWYSQAPRFFSSGNRFWAWGFNHDRTAYTLSTLNTDKWFWEEVINPSFNEKNCVMSTGYVVDHFALLLCSDSDESAHHSFFAVVDLKTGQEVYYGEMEVPACYGTGNSIEGNQIFGYCYGYIFRFTVTETSAAAELVLDVSGSANLINLKDGSLVFGPMQRDTKVVDKINDEALFVPGDKYFGWSSAKGFEPKVQEHPQWIRSVAETNTNFRG